MKYLALIPILALTACASTDYSLYSKAQIDIATAKSTADTARYAALASIAKDGDGASKVAAVMALALGGATQTQALQIAAPQRSDALMWASILVPGITQAYAIGKSADVAINSSNNAMLTSTATTSGFVGIASQIQAPGAITTTTDRHDSIVTTPTPVVVPDIVQITPVVVPDTVVITPIAQPVTP